MADESVMWVSFLLDETGSMDSVRDATISGFNEYLGTLKSNENKVLFTLTQFNSTKIDTVHAGTPVKSVAPLTRETYRPAANTPLYDAIAHVIHATEAAVEGKLTGPQVLVVIMTDGHENASREYNRDRIFRLISEKEAAGWTFAFLGANQDAWAVAESIGVQRGNSLNYAAAAPRAAFDAMGEATRDYIERPVHARKSKGLFDDKKDADDFLKRK